MKLVIQIPCFNEERTLPLVFEHMPRKIEGISEIEFQIIDDGSTDRTAEVARELGVHHIIRIAGANRRWLGRAFRIGVDEALSRGADIIVNTDGDNQYPSERIPELIAPILNREADIVIGNRHPGSWKEFSLVKRCLQRFGNWVASIVTRQQIPDAVSGFRAYSRSAAMSLHVTTDYTYTIDTLIQALMTGLSVAWIPIVPNAKTRDSRLIKSLFGKVSRSGVAILRVATIYEPFRLFGFLAVLFFVPGAFFVGRFLYFYFLVPAERAGHIQSVILGGVCLIVAVQMFMMGVLAELLGTNRKIIEQVSRKTRELEASLQRRKGTDKAGP